MEVPSRGGSQCPWHRLLRRRQSRRLLRRRQDRVQPAGRAHRRRRGGDGQGAGKTKIADLSQGETTPVAPLVVKRRVIVGASGGEFGIHGWLKGLDLETGRIVWTAYNIGPDSQVLAKPGTFKPFYDRGTELALTSWPADVWKNGGAPVWGWMSYDPDLDLLYYGTGNQ